MICQFFVFQLDVVIVVDVLYCLEVIVLLVGVLWRLVVCWEYQWVFEVYVVFIVCNLEICQLFIIELGWVGIRWEVEFCYDQKLFFYEEYLEMVILNFILQVLYMFFNVIVRIKLLLWEEFLYGKVDKIFSGLECLKNV